MYLSLKDLNAKTGQSLKNCYKRKCNTQIKISELYIQLNVQ